MNIRLVEAGSDGISILRRLMQLYLYDLGSLDGWDIGDDGAYGNAARIEAFWNTGQRDRYLVKADGKLAGFVLTRVGSYFSGEGAQEISEFFILKKYRLHGVGRMVATHIFDRFDGTWEVRVMRTNAPAQAFWRVVIAGYTDDCYEEFVAQHDTTQFVVFRFRGEDRAQRHLNDTEPAQPA
jgi:predicted acetyltransferase